MVGAVGVFWFEEKSPRLSLSVLRPGARLGLPELLSGSAPQHCPPNSGTSESSQLVPSLSHQAQTQTSGRVRNNFYSGDWGSNPEPFLTSCSTLSRHHVPTNLKMPQESHFPYTGRPLVKPHCIHSTGTGQPSAGNSCLSLPYALPPVCVRGLKGKTPGQESECLKVTRARQPRRLSCSAFCTDTNT